ncbi:uncharacterized protein PpBr36_10648 [Pyricularia pennisetigena]|uniref:uncharacterized protein n=1 Tax=Pyricularia pennisetigena TaxID=1578925 RepID=UPI001152C928|nr:uncharacterized protein PpBr36_10648 [Pyricularia pennisetigena]TLS21072.1 hypothetical protein PpBr36_10648 [Pyricularia pennisetigena]
MPIGCDRSRLSEACVSLVHTFDALKSVFLRANGRHWQVILDRPDVPVDYVDGEGHEESFDGVTSSLVESNHKIPLRPGHVFLRITILRNHKGRLRLVLGMSHAIWDGLSLPVILNSLHSLCAGFAVPPQPRLALHLKQHRKKYNKTIEYWKNALDALRKPDDRGGCLLRVVQVPAEGRAPGRITQAAIFTTACILVVADEMYWYFPPDGQRQSTVNGEMLLSSSYRIRPLTT